MSHAHGGQQKGRARASNGGGKGGADYHRNSRRTRSRSSQGYEDERGHYGPGRHSGGSAASDDRSRSPLNPTAPQRSFHHRDSVGGGFGNRSSGGNGRGGGGFGGGARGRGAPPRFVRDDLPEYSLEPAMGWLPYNFATKEEVELHTYYGPPGQIGGLLPAEDSMQKVSLSVNHFELERFILPERIYHYEVRMERVKEVGELKPRLRTSDEGCAKGGRGRGRGSPKQGSYRNPAGSDSQGQGGPPQLRRLPKPLPQLILQVLLPKIHEEYQHYGLVSDLSNNAYSTKRLEAVGIPLEFIVEMSDLDVDILQETDLSKVKVTFEATEQEINTEEMAKYLNDCNSWQGFPMNPSVKATLEQVYNAIVKSLPRFKFLAVGRSNLMRWPGQEWDITSNVVTWRGIAASVSMGWKPYLCADIAHTAFQKDTPVLEALSTQRWWSRHARPHDLSTWDRRMIQEASNYLRNLKVKYTLTWPKNKALAGPVTEILPTSVADTKFFWEERNKEVSVYEYFGEVYRVSLNPKGPCLLVKKRNQVPAELCTIKKGQSFSRKLDDQQTREMLGLAKKNPDVLEHEIIDEIKGLKAKENPVAKAWGVNLAAKMLHFSDARVLGPPKLRYGEGTEENRGQGFAELTPQDGQWEIWNSSYNFLQPKTVGKWGVLVLGDCRVHTDQVWNFVHKLRENGGRKGVIFSHDVPVFETMNSLKDFNNNVKAIKEILEKKFRACDIVLCVIPKKGSSLYSQVKQAAELHVGLLTQCVVGQSVFKGQDATVQNIILKINSKLGGVNYAVVTPLDKVTMMDTEDILKCPILVIGADVTHPPPGVTMKVGNRDVQIPSFAAVTGSIDKTGMPFMMDIKAQVKADRGAAEVIQDLEDMVYNMLKTFEQRTHGIRPRKIIYYRDGVGEGQFPEVLHTEMLAMRRACEKLSDYDGGQYRPKITFLTVQKRHKTRFFYHKSGSQTANPLPGTVVDREIVHQRELDFYLCSHKGMMGTSRPTRYHVLWDDSLFSADQIQTFTYYLCYMYVRCSKSVKIPAPTYYAHWAAARAKAFAEGMEEFYGNINDLNKKIKRDQKFIQNFPMHFV